MIRQPLVFLAEDNRGDVLLVRQALKEHGLQCDLHVADDGDKAAAFAERVGSEIPCPDLVLLDLNLPKREGLEILHLFRTNPACADVPVIMVTSSDSPRDRARAVELGANRYFCKPSGLDDFMELGAVARQLMRTPTSSG